MEFQMKLTTPIIENVVSEVHISLVMYVYFRFWLRFEFGSINLKLLHDFSSGYSVEVIQRQKKGGGIERWRPYWPIGNGRPHRHPATSTDAQQGKENPQGTTIKSNVSLSSLLFSFNSVSFSAFLSVNSFIRMFHWILKPGVYSTFSFRYSWYHFSDCWLIRSGTSVIIIHYSSILFVRCY